MVFLDFDREKWRIFLCGKWWLYHTFCIHSCTKNTLCIAENSNYGAFKEIEFREQMEWYECIKYECQYKYVSFLFYKRIFFFWNGIAKYCKMFYDKIIICNILLEFSKKSNRAIFEYTLICIGKVFSVVQEVRFAEAHESYSQPD